MPRNQDINSTETPTRDLARSNLRCVTCPGPDACGAIRLWRCFRALNFLPRKLLQNGVFERLRCAQTHHRLGLDLDGLAGLRVAAHARLAVRFHGAAEVRNHELTGCALALSHRELEELFKKERRDFLRSAALFREMRHDFRLAHWLGCH